jgi:hypothetical protein
MKCELIQLANYKISMFAHVMMFWEMDPKKVLSIWRDCTCDDVR